MDEPVHLLLQQRDGQWIVDKEIKIRESKQQRGLVSFELQEPVRRLILLRTDGKMADDMIINILKDFGCFTRAFYVSSRRER